MDGAAGPDRGLGGDVPAAERDRGGGAARPRGLPHPQHLRADLGAGGRVAAARPGLHLRRRLHHGQRQGGGVRAGPVAGRGHPRGDRQLQVRVDGVGGVKLQTKVLEVFTTTETAFSWMKACWRFHM